MTVTTTAATPVHRSMTGRARRRTARNASLMLTQVMLEMDDVLPPPVVAHIRAATVLLEARGCRGYQGATTLGSVLRGVGEMLDILDLDAGVEIETEDGRVMTADETYPHLVRDRAEADPGVCPLCGCDGRTRTPHAGGMWCCSACGGDVHRAAAVLTGRRR